MPARLTSPAGIAGAALILLLVVLAVFFATKKGIVHLIFSDRMTRRPTLPGMILAKRPAIIIPYRDGVSERDGKPQGRLAQLNRLLKFFEGKGFEIYVAEQTPGEKFNRGLMFNVAYLVAKHHGKHDSYILSDVDMIPDDALLEMYRELPDPVIHLSSPHTLDRSRVTAFNTPFGGVLAVNGDAYEQVNGFPNSFYGWGGEDNALYLRWAKLGKPVADAALGRMLDEEHASNAPSSLAKRLRLFEILKNDAKQWRNDGLAQIAGRMASYRVRDEPGGTPLNMPRSGTQPLYAAPPCPLIEPRGRAPGVTTRWTGRYMHILVDPVLADPGIHSP